MNIDNIVRMALPQIGVRLQNELILNVPVSSGALKISIKVKTTEEGLKITMLDYGMDVEFGTNPHVIDEDDLKDWARRELGDEDAAYFVAQSIEKHGTRPQPFIRPVFNNKFKQIVKEEIKKVVDKIDK